MNEILSEDLVPIAVFVSSLLARGLYAHRPNLE